MSRPLIRPVLAAAIALTATGGIADACAATPATMGSARSAAARGSASHATPTTGAAVLSTASTASTVSTASTLPYPLPAAAAYPTGCPIRKAPPGYGIVPRAPKPRVSEARVPGPVTLPARTVDLTAASGTGIWVTIFKGQAFTAATADDVVSHATRAHLTSIWLRTGSTREGLFGQSALATLLPRAHAAGLKVIAWDFPTLSDPAADAKRMVATADLVEAGQQVDGISPDVETKGEGVFLTGRRVAAYFSRVSAGVTTRPVIATVLRPTDYWWAGNYPYRSEAPYVDVFAPMIYWSCTEPGADTAQAVDRLRSLHKPVNAIGQAYDEGAYGRRGTPSPQEIWRFTDTAKRHGAIGASLYLYTGMTGRLWATFGAYPW